MKDIALIIAVLLAAIMTALWVADLQALRQYRQLVDVMQQLSAVQTAQGKNMQGIIESQELVIRALLKQSGVDELRQRLSDLEERAK